MIPSETLDDIRSRLANRAEDVAKLLLPGGKRMGKKWKCGDTSGNPGSSLEVELEGDKAGIWNDSAAGHGGDLIALWQEARGLSFPAAAKEAGEFVRVEVPERTNTRRKAPLSREDYHYFDPDPEPAPTAATKQRKRSEAESGLSLDWESAVAAVKTKDIYDITGWRGFSLEFAEWLKTAKLIGKIGSQWAIPVHDETGAVVRAHIRTDNGWTYSPGSVNTPLVIGNPAKANTTLVFESQWDAFAVLDKLNAHLPENSGIYAAIITRGASSNTDISGIAARHLVICPQNDPPDKTNKDGRTPAQEWLVRVLGTSCKTATRAVFETPAGHKDANDWIKDDAPEHLDVFHQVIERSIDPLLREVFSTDQILSTNTDDDPDSMIGHRRRFLGRGGSFVIVGSSGIGKSTLIADLTLHAGAGVAWHGVTFRRPMRGLVVQAENDNGDVAEMLRGAIKASSLDRDQLAVARANILWRRESGFFGEDFCIWLEKLIVATRAEFVVVDPLLSFIGGDISRQEVASEFLRKWLQPVLNRTGVIIVCIHHTGKPPTDSKSRSAWSESDFAYLGIGSSELTNWARSVAVLTPHGVDTGRFRFLIAKRGSRAGMVDTFTGMKSTSIYLRHADEGLGWVQCEAPDPSEMTSRNGGRKQSVTPEDVLKAIGSPGTTVMKSMLIAELAFRHKVSDRTARERVDNLLMTGFIHVASSEPRKGGGKAVERIAAGPPPAKGNNQMETSL
jgi:hypothetical protein